MSARVTAKVDKNTEIYVDFDRICNLAYYHALDIWARYDEKATEDPDNEYLKHKANEAWGEAKLICLFSQKYGGRFED